MARDQETDAEMDPETPPATGSSGGISIGVMTGGAAAAGDRASAEDRSRRAGTPTPPPSYTGAPTNVPGGIGIGVMTGGAAASGTDAKAVDASEQLLDAPPELATAVRTLREHLGMLNRTPDIAELDDGLNEIEEGVTSTGQVRRDRLQWLRDRLTLGATAAAGLASATAVVETIAQLTG
ncbi:hypothetical protein [Streptomyces sp. CBMA152]|uniref:hypothetical protein n=1 Tax=Streptomyces sp. CBMA152 TaxID=1896312 RepID=UPI00166124E0|nr:hypothetical protein [Streptomyces sp. CBMA152]MBD0747579.1 hypothetical protein [Streptomyces sp. CBMA152]